MKKIFQIFILFFFIHFLTGRLHYNRVFAQEGLTNYGIAITYQVTDEKYEDGDIVSLTDQNEILSLSKKEYDSKMFGVITTNPITVYRRPIENGVPILRNGQIYINVTNMNGDIASGDYLTSSQIPGKAMKATSLNSYIIGVALAGFDKSTGTEVDYNGKKITQGKILIALGIGPASPIFNKASGGLFGTFQNLTQAVLFNIATTESSDKIIRYVIALLIVCITVILNYRTFGRNISKGIEAIGRNPLAKSSIQTMIILNGILIALVTIGGVILALAIISL